MSARKTGADLPYIQREEKYAVINGADDVRVLTKSMESASKIARRLSDEKVGTRPYRVAKVLVFEDLSNV